MQQPIAYTVCATFSDPTLVDAWLAWLRGGHIDEVCAGGARSAVIVQLDTPPHSYEVRYLFPSREAFDRYEREHAPRLRADGLQLFPPEKGISYRRSVGIVLDSR